MPRRTHAQGRSRWADDPRSGASRRTANAIADALRDLRAADPAHPRFRQDTHR